MKREKGRAREGGRGENEGAREGGREGDKERVTSELSSSSLIGIFLPC